MLRMWMSPNLLEDSLQRGSHKAGVSADETNEPKSSFC